MSAEPVTRTLPLRIRGNVQVVCSAALDDMTTYVLLEQDDWFEAEMAFVRAFAGPAMTMIDVGANHGVYALTFASRVEGTGHVWALEPASSPFALLEQGVAVNGFGTVMTPLQVGLSDRPRTSKMYLSTLSELNSLHLETDRTETVRLDAMDEFVSNQCAGRRIDFVKLDAEGEELNILAGGARFFTDQSPLVMFELRHGEVVNEGLWTRLVELGYLPYRLVPGLNVLCPVDPGQVLDSFVLNLFAAKPDRALQLCRMGLLSLDAGFGDEGQPHRRWIEALRACPYSRPVLEEWIVTMTRSPTPLETDHAGALDAYLSSMDPALTPGRRVALLAQAASIWERLCRRNGAPLSLLMCAARANNDLGRRSLALDHLRRIRAAMQTDAADGLRLPFLPPSNYYDQRDVSVESYGHWLHASIMEASESWSWYSSFFAPDTTERLKSTLPNPHASVAMLRRYLLAALRGGKRPSASDFTRALIPGPDNLNAATFAELQAAS